MNVHKNARLTPRGRERFVRQIESGQTPGPSAEPQASASGRVRKWVDRYRPRGIGRLQDRSSPAASAAPPTPQQLSHTSSSCAASAGPAADRLRAQVCRVHRQRRAASAWPWTAQRP